MSELDRSVLPKTELENPRAFDRLKIAEISLKELVDFIDWTFFFTSWDIPRRFPSVLEDEKYGDAARALFKDAESVLGEIIENDPMIKHELVNWDLQEWVSIDGSKPHFPNHLG